METYPSVGRDYDIQGDARVLDLTVDYFLGLNSLHGAVSF